MQDTNVPFQGDPEKIPMIAYACPPFTRLVSNTSTRYYDLSESGIPHVFPFHQACYHDILQRCLDQGKPGQIRGDILFDVLEVLNVARYVRLNLNYGEPDPPAEQILCSPRGQEVKLSLACLERMITAYLDRF